MTVQTQQILEELKTRLTELYGDRLERLVLYGSQARGDAGPDSDIDVLVVLRGEGELKGEHERRIDAMVEWNLKYGILVSPLPVTSEYYRTRNSPLLINIRREGIPL